MADIPRLVIEEEKEEICGVIRAYGIRKGKPCNMKFEEGACPYHPHRIEAVNYCTYKRATGGECGHQVLQYDAKWCTRHLNKALELQENQRPPPPTFPRLARLGSYLIIRETNFAISDDGLSIIGEVELKDGRFYLKKVLTTRMTQVSKLNNIKIQFDSE
jgi:hypothetical protein